MKTKSWKMTVIGLILLTIMVAACISIQAISATPTTPQTTESSTPEPETVNPFDDVAPSEPSTTPEISVPDTSMPEEPIPEESAPESSEPEATVPLEPIPEPDIITDINVKLYNDNQEGFNPIDGRAYLDDIAALLRKHAPEGLRISCGCAMAYTEGGSGKKGVYVQTNNCFGIRATPGWSGWVFARSTLKVYKDYETAMRYGATDLFRAYPTMEDSVLDYIGHMKNNRYNAVLGMDNNADYLNYIVNQGYGEKHLANDWLWLIGYYNLDQYNIDWNATESEEPAE